jgi:regulator of sigma D
MMRAKTFLLVALGLASVATLPGTTLQFTGIDANRSFSTYFTIHYTAGQTMFDGAVASGPTNRQLAYAPGVMSLVVNDGSLRAYDAFCVDLFNYISEGTTYNVNFLSTSVINGGDRVAWLMQNVLPSINQLPNGVEKQKRAAALQLAIWDIVHDNGNGFNFSSGSTANRIFQSIVSGQPTDAQVLQYIDIYLAASLNQSVNPSIVFREVQGVAAMQSLVAVSTPEPGTWSMFAAGVAALVAGRWRRRRKA